MQEAKVKMGDNGRVVIPAPYRKALGIGPGDEIVLRLSDGELRLMSRATAIKRAQELVRRYIPEERSLVDDLSAERRAEAANE